jgi:predicted amidophosphoribosyltransferase
MNRADTKDTNMITITAICKGCGKTFEKQLPRYFVDICGQAGAEGFKSTCPQCAAADPIFSALHPEL